MNSQKKCFVQWACRRGMLELDILLEFFFQNHFDNLSPQQVEDLEILLQAEDSELYAWLIDGHTPVETHAHIIEYIRSHTQSVHDFNQE